MAKIKGSEPDDIIPRDWDASLDALKQEVWFSVSYFMDIPEIEGYQHESMFNTAAGMLGVNLKELIDEYMENCLEEDDGDGLLPLADLFAEYAEKLREKAESLDPEEVKAAKNFSLVIRSENE